MNFHWASTLASTSLSDKARGVSKTKSTSNWVVRHPRRGSPVNRPGRVYLVPLDWLLVELIWCLILYFVNYFGLGHSLICNPTQNYRKCQASVGPVRQQQANKSVTFPTSFGALFRRSFFFPNWIYVLKLNSLYAHLETTRELPSKEKTRWAAK